MRPPYSKSRTFYAGKNNENSGQCERKIGTSSIFKGSSRFHNPIVQIPGCVEYSKLIGFIMIDAEILS